MKLKLTGLMIALKLHGATPNIEVEKMITDAESFNVCDMTERAYVTLADLKKFNFGRVSFKNVTIIRDYDGVVLKAWKKPVKNCDSISTIRDSNEAKRSPHELENVRPLFELDEMDFSIHSDDLEGMNEKTTCELKRFN
jgi:hypothetical protein